VKFDQLYPGLVLAWGPDIISMVGNSLGNDVFLLVDLEEQENGDFSIDNRSINKSDWTGVWLDGRPISSSVVKKMSDNMTYTIIQKIFDPFSKLFR
jgi:hypothetical protein